jgi:hypothetical protein
MAYLKKYTPYLIIILSLGFFFCLLTPAQAQGVLPACVGTGRCTLCDMVQTVINIGLYLLGIVGAIVLLFFVYGGFLMLTSGGAPDRIKKGKDVLINATIGLGIAFLAYTVVTFTVSAVTKSGWDWQANLKCAELPAPKKYNAPTSAPEKKEGTECNASSDCETNLFCDDTGHCKEKLKGGEDCLGKTYEAKEFADNKGIVLSALHYDPIFRTAEVTTLAIKSNDACISNDCNILNRSGYGKCDTEGTAKENEDCFFSSNCVDGLFCKGSISAVGTPGKCTKYLALSETCDGIAKDEDDIACGPDAYCEDGKMGAGISSPNICLPQDNKGAIDDPCNETEQCRGSSFCASVKPGENWPPNNAPGPEYPVGMCKNKLSNGSWCDGWTVKGDEDNNVCKSNNCDDPTVTPIPGVTYTYKCIP